MTINELFWAAAFGAALGVAGTTALLGILSWAWRRIALWWISRKIRLDLLKHNPDGPGVAPPPPNYPTPEEILGMARGMGSPLPGAAVGIQACYTGPAREVGTVVSSKDMPPQKPYPFPGVLREMILDNGLACFVVHAEWSQGAACPCCWQKGEVLNKTFSKEFLEALKPLAGPSRGFPIPEDLPPPTKAS